MKVHTITTLIYFINSLALSKTRPQCSHSYCNNEGECYLKNGEKTCQCLEGAYEGSRCTIIKDNCMNNPCKNGGVCKNFVGNFYCDCESTYSGQNCSFKLPNMFRKLYLHYNHVVQLNEEEYFIIIVEYIGNVQTALQLHSSDHILESFAFPKTGPKFFQHSHNLRSIGSKFGIRKSLNIPFLNGFYVAFKTRITKLGHIPLTLSLSDYENGDMYFYNEFYIFSYAQEKQCIPIIRFSKCQSPQLPLRVGIGEYNTFDPVVERSCGSDSTLRYKWSLWNYLDWKLFHSFEDGNERVLVIAPRTLWFDDESPIFRSFFALKLEVTEINKKTSRQGKSISRCYILVILRPPHAVIRGGNFREVHVGKEVVLDASESCDENLPKGSGKHKLTFSWNCSTESVNNYCKANMGKGRILKIPANALLVGKKYNFTVTVGARTTRKTDISWQEITPLNENLFLVTINCVRNCVRMLTNRQDMLHLAAVCVDCKRGIKMSYKWSITSPQSEIKQFTERFILDGSLLPETEKIVIQAEIQQQPRRGKSRIELEINKPPKSGKCSCDPKSGTEYDTMFLIECTNFEDPNEPLSYTFSQGNKILSRTAQESFKTRLSTIEQGGVLKVEVCDYYHACTTVDVDVQVTEKAIPSDAKQLRWFLLARYANTNLWKILKSGDTTSAMVLINMVARQLPKMAKNNQKIKTVNEILKMMTNFDVKTTVTALQLSSSLRDLILSTEMDHKIVVLLGSILDNISQGFIHLARSGEIENMQWSEFVNTTKNLMETFVGMFEQINVIPNTHNSVSFEDNSDPFHENYPDYGELDFEVVYIINDWLAGTVSVQRVLHGLGVASSNLLNPNEPGINLTVSDMSLRFFVINKDNAGINLNQWGNDIDIKSNVLMEICRAKNSTNLGLQSAVMQKNPFWWFPEQFKMNSDVIFLSIFGDEPEDFSPDGNSITTNRYFDIFMNIKPENQTSPTNQIIPTNQTSPTNDSLQVVKTEISGYVNANKDIATYGAKLPQNSLIIYEFISLDADIRALVKINRKPRYWMMAKEYKIIRKFSNASKITVMNELGEESQAYIAIIPHGSVSQEKVNFTFTMKTYSCGTWSLTTSNWSLQHCYVGYKTTDSRIHCRCNHMSTFASKVHMTPNKLILSGGVILAVDINILFLGIIALLIVLFIILLVWACYKDKHDCQDVFVGSQNPRNTYMYIVTVSTGSLPQSGTTANVTIQLHGEKGNSEQYLLNTGKCKTILGKDSVYAFTLLAPKSLGTLRSITLSHDSAGRYPSWFCSSVRVKDVSSRQEYIFLVRKWLSLIYSDSTTITISLSTKNELTKFKYLLREHTGSIFASCFLCQLFCSTHTRSILNRKEKAMTLVTAKMVAALVSVLFFGKTTVQNIEDERDEYQKIIIKTRIFIIMTISTVVGGLTLYFITLCFIKAKTKKENKYNVIFAE